MRLADLRLEIHEGLQILEQWNSANGVIFYGKSVFRAMRRGESVTTDA